MERTDRAIWRHLKEISILINKVTIKDVRLIIIVDHSISAVSNLIRLEI